MSKLETLAQAMLSLKVDQNDCYNDINSLLNNKSKEFDVVRKLKNEIRRLTLVQSDMQTTQGLIEHLTNDIKVINNKKPKENNKDADESAD